MEGPHVLVVGAGGIGCELLKTLVLNNYTKITVVDLDTIDKTNLNRQFLFKRNDIGKSKAEVAAKVIKELRPNVQINGINGNITSFDDSFFQQFSIVFNALDNLAARRYVNRMCNFSNIPLIDAGTKSKSGQVTIHIPKVTSCYDCEPKAVQKEYPVCTIRLTPSKPEHCIAWGKYLYEALFGPEDPSNILSDMQIDTNSDISTLFQLLFIKDMPEKARLLDFPLSYSLQLIKETGIPTYEELVNGLAYSYEALKNREKRPFSKNDKIAVQFIAAISNIRAIIFNISVIELFKVEEIAGLIIPAIGSTNAIVAGLQVIEAEKILKHQSTYGTV